jgi:hypothetical protein
MRLAGRFSLRMPGCAKAHDIPVIDCSAGERKHDIADDYLAKTTVLEVLFLVLAERAQAPVWHVRANNHLEKNVQRFSFGGAAHKPRLGEHPSWGRAGERKTCWTKSLPPPLVRWALNSAGFLSGAAPGQSE